MLIVSKDFDFNEGEHGWVHGFADYPAGPDSTLFELKYEYTDQPQGSILTRRSVMLSGRNVNRDLCMFLKKKITGLQPGREYIITFNVELATNLAPASTSSGAVYLKAGASHTEPKRVIESGRFVLNLDKGETNLSGEDMISLGVIPLPSQVNNYAMITKNNTMSNSRYVAKANSNGEIWLIIGTDSSLEGTNTFFYTRVKVLFSAS